MTERATRDSGCVMQRMSVGAIAHCVLRGGLALMLLVLLSHHACASAAAADTLHWPLALAPRTLTGGFGEARSNHFHAGLDLSTLRQTGVPVLAPATGVIERVRTSGVGYGRSLYLRTEAGALIVFGHLDAFAPRIAAWMDSVQRVTGDYEQDLWPAPGSFPCTMGERIAWSGQSGAGPPHLHVEVRHGDFALSPLRAGLAVADTSPPRLEQLVLEPLDERSWVQRKAGPHTHVLRASSDTMLVEGRVRLTLRASDAAAGATRLPVYSLGARWAGAWVECRMDSVSWAGEMSQLNWLLDSGRVVGGDGVILDAPAGFRPRFLHASRPESLAVELVRVAAGDPPRPLDLFARDAAGHEVMRRVWLRGPAPHEQGPDTTGRGVAGAQREVRWAFACLPDQRLRIRVTGAPGGLRSVRIERGGTVPAISGGMPATWDGHGWVAVLDVGGLPDPDGFWIKGTGADGRAWWERGVYALWPTASAMTIRIEDWAWLLVPETHTYESGVAMVRSAPVGAVGEGAAGIRAALEVQPVQLPLKRPVTVTLRLPAGLAFERTSLYRRDSDRDEWEWADGVADTLARTFSCETSRLGQFALLRDHAPPELTPLPYARHVPRGAYSTWALTARVVDRTSGVAGRASGFTVDGARVPTEWDPEARVLRWRPGTAPTPGTHPWRVEAVDRCGNRSEKRGVFVIDSVGQ
jgi:hypothetical protein